MTTPSTETVAPGIGVAAPGPCTSWMKESATSSLTIVPWPCPSVTVTPVPTTLVTLTKKVSFVSITASPLTSTVKV